MITNTLITLFEVLLVYAVGFVQKYEKTRKWREETFRFEVF